MHGNDPSSEQHMRVLIEHLVREGRTEREIANAVRRAESDGGIVLRTRRLSFFR